MREIDESLSSLQFHTFIVSTVRHHDWFQSGLCAFVEVRYIIMFEDVGFRTPCCINILMNANISYKSIAYIFYDVMWRNEENTTQAAWEIAISHELIT